MKKPILLGTALVASLGLIGGTFAAFMVSDKADPKSVIITPGTVQIDTYKKVTLEWGEVGLIENIEGITGGTTTDDYKMQLLASYTGYEAKELDEDGYHGQFVVTVEDLTDHVPNYAKLIDFLTINIYGSQDANREALGSIKTVGVHSFYVTVPYGSVGIDRFISISMAHVTSEQMEQVKNDQIRLTIDWNKAAGDADAADSEKNIYANFPANVTNQRFYFWGDDSQEDWPGREAQQVEGLNYTITCPDIYDSMIMNWDGGKTIDIKDIPDADYVYCFYDYEKSTYTWNTEYALKGKYGENTWATSDENLLKFTLAHAETFEFVCKDVELVDGDQFKAHSDGDMWFGGNPDGDQGNIDIKAEGGDYVPGTYDIYFRPLGNAGEGWNGCFYLSLVK